MALSLKKQNKTFLLVTTDIIQAGDIDQLKKLKSDLNVLVIEGRRVATVDYPSNVESKEGDIDVVIVDTAGRLNIDEALMGELIATKMAAASGRTGIGGEPRLVKAAPLTKSFADAIDITGAILTKLDGIPEVAQRCR